MLLNHSVFMHDFDGRSVTVESVETYFTQDCVEEPAWLEQLQSGSVALGVHSEAFILVNLGGRTDLLVVSV